MNEPQKGRSARIWFYVSLGMIGIALPLHFRGVDEKAVRALGVVYLLIWYYGAGRAQARYVKAKYGDDYPRKPWGKPLLIALASVVGYFGVVVVLVIVAGLVEVN